VWRSVNRDNKADNEAKGFKVIWIEKDVTAHAMRDALSDEYLYQYTFAGHGYLNDTDKGSLEGLNNIALRPGRYTKHGINLLMLYACNSALKMEHAGEEKYYRYNIWERNVATRGLFIGYDGETHMLNAASRLRWTSGSNRKGAR